METVVDKRSSETVKATPSTVHEQKENLVVLAEDEMQTSSDEGGIKTSEVVPNAVRTEIADSQSFKKESAFTKEEDKR